MLEVFRLHGLIQSDKGRSRNASSHARTESSGHHRRAFTTGDDRSPPADIHDIITPTPSPAICAAHEKCHCVASAKAPVHIRSASHANYDSSRSASTNVIRIRGSRLMEDHADILLRFRQKSAGTEPAVASNSLFYLTNAADDVDVANGNGTDLLLDVGRRIAREPLPRNHAHLEPPQKLANVSDMPAESTLTLSSGESPLTERNSTHLLGSVPSLDHLSSTPRDALSSRQSVPLQFAPIRPKSTLMPMTDPLGTKSEFVHKSESTIAITDSPSASYLNIRRETIAEREMQSAVVTENKVIVTSDNIMSGSLQRPGVIRALSDNSPLTTGPDPLGIISDSGSASILSDDRSSPLCRPPVYRFLEPINDLKGAVPIAVQPAKTFDDLNRADKWSGSQLPQALARPASAGKHRVFFAPIHSRAFSRSRSRSAAPTEISDRTHRHHRYQQKQNSDDLSYFTSSSGTLDARSPQPFVDLNRSAASSIKGLALPQPSTPEPTNIEISSRKFKKSIPERIVSFFRGPKGNHRTISITPPSSPVHPRPVHANSPSISWISNLRFSPSRHSSGDKDEKTTSFSQTKLDPILKPHRPHIIQTRSLEQRPSNRIRPEETGASQSFKSSQVYLQVDGAKPPLNPSHHDHHENNMGSNLDITMVNDLLHMKSGSGQSSHGANSANNLQQITGTQASTKSLPLAVWNEFEIEPPIGSSNLHSKATIYGTSTESLSPNIDDSYHTVSTLSESYDRIHADPILMPHVIPRPISSLDDFARPPEREIAFIKIPKKLKHFIHLKRSHSETLGSVSPFPSDTNIKEQSHAGTRRQQKSKTTQQTSSHDALSYSASDRNQTRNQNQVAHARIQPNELIRPRSSMAQQRIVETSVIYYKEENGTTIMGPWGEPEQRMGKVNQYHILREIGSGSYGRVVLVRSDQTGRYYACKVISKSRLRKKFRWINTQNSNFATPKRPSSSSLPFMSNKMSDEAFMGTIKREVAILKKLSQHPNIVNLVEVLDDGKEDNLYMIFELCEFGPVMEIRVGQPARPFSETLARKYFRDVVLGLEYLHYKRIIHTDIKPENLLRTAENVVQIADFGISHILEEDQGDQLVLANNASPLFSAPETCMPNAGTVNGKALDIWSLGVTLYCFVHGRCPWESEEVVELSRMIAHEDFVMSDTISESLKDLIRKMLNKNPNERIQIEGIKVHPWVTTDDSDPMLSTEENCVYEEVTEEEVENAFRPAMMFVNKIINKLKGGRRKSVKVQRPETAGQTRSTRSSVSGVSAITSLSNSTPYSPSISVKSPSSVRTNTHSASSSTSSRSSAVGADDNSVTNSTSSRPSSENNKKRSASSTKRAPATQIGMSPKPLKSWSLGQKSFELGSANIETERQQILHGSEHKSMHAYFGNTHNRSLEHIRTTAHHASKSTHTVTISQQDHPIQPTQSKPQPTPPKTQPTQSKPQQAQSKPQQAQSKTQPAQSKPQQAHLLQKRLGRERSRSSGLTLESGFTGVLYPDGIYGTNSRGTGPHSEWGSFIDRKIQEKHFNPFHKTSSASISSPGLHGRKKDLNATPNQQSTSSAATVTTPRLPHANLLTVSRPNLAGPVSLRTPRLPHEI